MDVISMSRNIEKSESYFNSSFEGCALERANLRLPTRLIVDLAAKCSKAVYNKPASENLKAHLFVQSGETRKIRKDNSGVLMKATTISLYKGAGELAGPDAHSVMVVAIRGTATLHDWYANFNDTSQLESRTAVLNVNNGEDGLVESNLLGSTVTNSPYTMHGGFLACAKLMTDLVAQKSKETLRDAPSGRIPILVFTSYSAGGTVAALLYTHFARSTEQTELTALRHAFVTVYCFTFGAPPITSPALAPFNHRTQFLAFVNESDLIPRCDRPYLRSLLRLFVSPMPKAGTLKCDLPEPVLYNAGEVILIQEGPKGQLILSKTKAEGVGSMKKQ